MEKPNKEQLMYAMLGIAESQINYIFDNLDDTIFDDEGLNDILSALQIGFVAARDGMNTLFERIQDERKRRCY